jgi:hypothetical protein
MVISEKKVRLIGGLLCLSGWVIALFMTKEVLNSEAICFPWSTKEAIASVSTREIVMLPVILGCIVLSFSNRIAKRYS